MEKVYGRTITIQHHILLPWYADPWLGRAINVTLDRENGTVEDVYDGRILIRGTGRTVYQTLILAHES